MAKSAGKLSFLSKQLFKCEGWEWPLLISPTDYHPWVPKSRTQTGCEVLKQVFPSLNERRCTQLRKHLFYLLWGEHGMWGGEQVGQKGCGCWGLCSGVGLSILYCKLQELVENWPLLSHFFSSFSLKVLIMLSTCAAVYFFMNTCGSECIGGDAMAKASLLSSLHFTVFRRPKMAIGFSSVRLFNSFWWVFFFSF